MSICPIIAACFSIIFPQYHFAVHYFSKENKTYKQSNRNIKRINFLKGFQYLCLCCFSPLTSRIRLGQWILVFIICMKSIVFKSKRNMVGILSAHTQFCLDFKCLQIDKHFSSKGKVYLVINFLRSQICIWKVLPLRNFIMTS